jgi:hypothetical protein
VEFFKLMDVGFLAGYCDDGAAGRAQDNDLEIQEMGRQRKRTLFHGAWSELVRTHMVNRGVRRQQNADNGTPHATEHRSARGR